MTLAEYCFHPPSSQQGCDPHRRWPTEMASQGNRSSHRYPPWSAKIYHPLFLPGCLPYLNNIRKSKRCIGVMKCIPTWMNMLFLDRVLSILFFLLWRPTSANTSWSCAAMSFSPSREVLSVMCRFRSGHWDARSLIRVTQWSVRRSHCSGPAPSLLLMIMDWAISQMHSWLYYLSVVLSSHLPAAQSAWFLLPIGWLQHLQSCHRDGLVESASGLY